jgi:Protein of unknown function (DUF3574)
MHTPARTYRALGLALVLGLLAGVPHGAIRSALAEERRTEPMFVGERFARTELFFGSARPGGEVTDAEFQQFLDGFVKPRFPDGLTLLVGLGQWRGAEGAPVRERSMLLILLYPDAERWESSRRIEEIRDEYKWRFQQQSVLRSDRCCETVGF